MLPNKEEENNPSSSSSSDINNPDKDRTSFDAQISSLPANSPISISTRPSSLKTIQNNQYCSERKMSSPICVYYRSSQKFLSQLFEQKTKEEGYDLYKSGNYIDKDSLLNGGGLGEGYYNNINKFNNCGRNSLPTPGDNKKFIRYNNGTNRFKSEDEMFNYKMNYCEDYPQRKNKFFTFNINGNNNHNQMDIEGDFISYQHTQPKIVKDNYNNNMTVPQPPSNLLNNNNQNIFNTNNSASLQVKNKMKKMNGNIKERKKAKVFVEREGDWVCSQCRNLNFAFRIVCNRCGTPKGENNVIIKVGNNGNVNKGKYNINGNTTTNTNEDNIE